MLHQIVVSSDAHSDLLSGESSSHAFKFWRFPQLTVFLLVHRSVACICTFYTRPRKSCAEDLTLNLVQTAREQVQLTVHVGP